jgi:ATP-dependent Clp protease adapter protein ClpS
MIILGFIIGALVVGLVLYLPFFVWFRFRARHKAGRVSRDLQLSLHVAFIEARRRRYVTVSMEQLLLALLDNPRVVDVLRACSFDIEGIRRTLSEVVRKASPVAAGTGAVDSQASPEFKRVLQRAIGRVQAVARSTSNRRNAPKPLSGAPAILRRSAGQGIADGADVLIAILEEPDSSAADELRRHGVTRLALTNAIAHGITSADQVATPALRADGIEEMTVILENDDFTPMEFVVGVLQDHFGLNLASATQIMLDIHNDGRGVCGRFSAHVAAEKVERVRAAAIQAGHPLRCLIEAR